MIRRLEHEDIPRVADMVKQSFSPHLWPYMTYTQHGAGAYLDVAVRFPLSVEPRYLVVTADERTDSPIGFADFTVVDRRIGFLSYICVAPEVQGRGLATAMFNAFLGVHPDVRTVRLDTFRHNTVARSLYEGWGFAVEETSAWITRPLPPADLPPAVRGLSVSLAAHNAYGFCELHLDRPRADETVGMLGEHVLRCFSRSTFEDDALLASVRGLTGTPDTAFAVVPEAVEHEMRVPHEVLLLSDRMALDVSGFRA
ncbi:hypothetical protein GCM10028798_14120 [Humibacter antri]